MQKRICNCVKVKNAISIDKIESGGNDRLDHEKK